MIRLTENRLFLILTAVFTALAVMVSFCFAFSEALAGFVAWGAGGLIEGVDYVIPSPAEDPALLINTGDTQTLSPGTGFQRVFIPGGTHGAASAFYQPRFRTSSHIRYINVKKIIPLKLRI